MPDATTVWLFRERVVKEKVIDKLFARFDAAHTDRGYLAMGGQIIDATVVPAPKQRNTEAEKTAIKEGRVPEAWKGKPAKLRQKDRDARWSVKYSKAKVKDGADPRRSNQSTLPSRCLATKTTSASTGRIMRKPASEGHSGTKIRDTDQENGAPHAQFWYPFASTPKLAGSSRRPIARLFSFPSGRYGPKTS